MKVITFSAPKIGESESSSQDRFAVSLDKSLIALADGAGSSLYPRKWAEILVNLFCQSDEHPIEKMKQSYQDWLKLAQVQWQQYYLQQLTNPQLKWWQKGSDLKTYAAATFLGFSLQSQPKRWQGVVVGDSCLFKFSPKTGKLVVFPAKTAQDFKSTTPCLISSPEMDSFDPQFTEGSYQKGDRFLLATDALSQWILRSYENQEQDWLKCFTLKESEEFGEILTQLRQTKSIKNDDTTMIIIQIN